MLIQKRRTPRKMILLWMGVGAIVIIAFFLVYQSISTSSVQPPQTTNQAKRLSAPKDFGDKVFGDPKFNLVTQPKDESDFTYTNQRPVIVKEAGTINPPSGLKVLNPGYGGKLYISWSASTDDVTGYAIFRSSSIGATFDQLASVDKQTLRLTDTAVENDHEYYYRVEAIKTVEAKRSATVKAGKADGDTFSVDLISGSGTTLSWKNPSPAPAALQIVRTREGEKPAVIATLAQDETTYVDAAGIETDSYAVVWFSTYIESALTPIVSAKPTDVTPPLQPIDVKIANTGDGKNIVISWTNPLDSDFDKVRIYQSTRQGVLGQLIKDEKSTSLFEGETCIEVEASRLHGEGECMIVTGLSEGQTYYFTLTSVDVAGNESTKKIISTYGNPSPFGAL